MNSDKLHFWAKTTDNGRQPGISVRDHCLNVGCVAEALVATLPERLRALLPGPDGKAAVTLAALHDVGKITPGFQQKCDEWRRQVGWQDGRSFEGNHALVSQCFLSSLLGDELLEPWAEALGAHHGFPLEARNFTREPDASWRKAREALVKELSQPGVFGPLPGQPPLSEAAKWLFAGLVAFADWIGSTDSIGSDEGFFSPEREPPRQLSCQRARAKVVLSALAFDGELPLNPGLDFRKAWGFEPYPFQRELIAAVNGPGVYVVEAQMGSGKTEAALYAAYQLIARRQARGLFFALPTQVTSNRIHERVERLLRRTGWPQPETRLIHSGSWLARGEVPGWGTAYPGEDERDRIRRRRWFASSRKALVAPFGVGTVDQALLGIIAAKFFFARQFALAGKVVILDEVHSYDAYTGGLLGLLVRRLRELQSTVIILSATLTSRHRRGLLSEEYGVETRDGRLAWITAWTPSVGLTRSASDSGLRAKRVRLRFRRPDERDMAEECLNRAAEGQCVLWICNTVDAAIHTRRRLLCEWQERDGTQRPPIALLHSRFPWFRRQQLELEWLRRLGKGPKEPEEPNRFRPRGCVLVSTQVVEQSVDIDADFLVTELAPTDMLFQRLGRLWRHEFRPAGQRGTASGPEAVILAPDLTSLDSPAARTALGKCARVYDPFVLARSWRQWHDQSEVTVPDEIRPWLEATYADFDPQAEAAWTDLHQRFQDKQRKLEALAFHSANVDFKNPEDDDEERARTRLQTLATAELVVARAVLSERPLTLLLLDGSTVTLLERHYAVDRMAALKAAQAVHRNVVKIPAWWLDDVPDSRLPALGEHFFGQWRLAVKQPPAAGGDLEQLRFHGSSPPELRLAYHPHEGVVMEREPKPKSDYLDDDRFQLDD